MKIDKIFNILFRPFLSLEKINRFEKIVYGTATKPSWLYVYTKHWTFGFCFKHMEKLYPDCEWYTWECYTCKKEYYDKRARKYQNKQE